MCGLSGPWEVSLLCAGVEEILQAGFVKELGLSVPICLDVFLVGAGRGGGGGLGFGALLEVELGAKQEPEC